MFFVVRVAVVEDATVLPLGVLTSPCVDGGVDVAKELVFFSVHVVDSFADLFTVIYAHALFKYSHNGPVLIRIFPFGLWVKAELV